MPAESNSGLKGSCSISEHVGWSRIEWLMHSSRHQLHKHEFVVLDFVWGLSNWLHFINRSQARIGLSWYIVHCYDSKCAQFHYWNSVLHIYCHQLNNKNGVDCKFVRWIVVAFKYQVHGLRFEAYLLILSQLRRLYYQQCELEFPVPCNYGRLREIQ